ncbi:MAG: hypothetical protein L2C94_002150 [Aigarchaeota archaeon]|nr:hypothetical protein [Candidatus Wolframiiraptor gerlachensis]
MPVVMTIATRGRSVYPDTRCRYESSIEPDTPKKIRYGKEVEERVERLEAALGEIDPPYPRRWIALKLLEKDEEIWGLVGEKNPRVIELASELITELESIHGHDSLIIIANERACIASQIARRCIRIVKPRKPTLGDRFDEIATHPILELHSLPP